MSQLPPPNFGNFPQAINMSGIPGWPMQTAPSIFGRPQSPSMSFTPLLPINSFAGYPGCHIMPGIRPNIDLLRPQFHHVVSRERNISSFQQQRPQVTNVQGTTSKRTENVQNFTLSKEFSCDACQKDFSSKETLNAHLGSHVQCSYEGCTFKAGRKVLKLHWIQTHETGRMRIKLDTPEEIAKWREDRKRKYPTLANVQRKTEEEAKRNASGHVLKTKNFRYRRGQCRGRSFQRGGYNHFNNRSHSKRGRQETNGVEASIHQAKQQHENQERAPQGSNRLQNGEDPLSLVLEDCDEHDEPENQTKERLSSQERLSNATSANSEEAPSDGISTISALSSLCSAYASDSDDDNKPSEINNNMKTDSPQHATEAEAGHAAKCMSDVRHDVRKEQRTRTKRPPRRSRKNFSKANGNHMGVRKSTLLEKLLAPDIRHERNVILQCLRHIVKNNFFGVGDTSISENVVNN